MQPERWKRIREILESALEYDPSERSAFLDAACGSDTSLRREVVSLLVSHEKAGDFGGSVFEKGIRVIGHAEASALLGRRIGVYRIVREIGRGGMGTVYLAVRADDAFRKEVAVKLIQRGLDSEDLVRRFRGERQILASLEHPNITRLLDGGATEDGLPYFVMEYIRGEPIDKYCEGRRLDLNARLKLFQSVCSAVHYAHQNLVIHRDIKSSNVLVTADGVPRLLDFGIAKILTNDSAESPGGAVTAARLMTPEYASPEQVRGEPITTTTDIYSLGVLLYELLTGRRPYQLAGTTTREVERAICEQEPARPSAVASQQLSRRLRGDLDNIVLMAMRKEPQRRYSSAEQFAEDIRRHLEGLPVAAQKDTASYRSGKFIRRHKPLIAAALLAVLSLISATGVSVWQARIASAERDRARLEKAKAQRINAFLQSVLAFADSSWYSPSPRKNPDAKVSEAVEQAAARAETELAGEPEVLAETERTIGNIYFGLTQFDRAEHFLRSALEKQTKLYGKNHLDIAQTSSNLAGALMREGNLADAEGLFRESLEIYRNQPGGAATEALAYAAALGGLGQTLVLKEGVSKEAESYIREALRYAPQMTGNTRALAGLLRNDLAGALYARGDLAQMEGLLRAAIDDYRSLPGHEYVELATGLSNLGAVLMREGRFTEAEGLVREGWEMTEKLFGPRHLSAAAIEITLAEIQYYKGDYQIAERAIRDVLGIYNQTLPKEHLAFSAAFRVLGLVLNRTGRSREGESYIRQAIDLRTRLQPNGHEAIALLESCLGECLTTQKRYAEAEPLLLRSYDIVKPAVGTWDVWRIETIQRLVVLYESWGKAAEAERYRQALAQFGSARPTSSSPQ